MKNQFKLLLVVGLLALMMPLLFGALGPVGASSSEIVADHADSKNIDNATCNNCHDPNELDPNSSEFSGAHRRHFLTAFLNFYGSTPADNVGNYGCGTCHDETVYGGGVGEGLGSGYEGDLSYATAETTDVAQAFGRAARKGVKPDVCESCHGQFNGATPGHVSVTVQNSCVSSGSCHVDPGTGGDAATKHSSVGYINTDHADSPTFCSRCHGENAWYLTVETSATLP